MKKRERGRKLTFHGQSRRRASEHEVRASTPPSAVPSSLRCMLWGTIQGED